MEVTISIRLGHLQWVPTAHCAGRQGLNLLTAVRPVELSQCYRLSFISTNSHWAECAHQHHTILGFYHTASALKPHDNTVGNGAGYISEPLRKEQRFGVWIKNCIRENTMKFTSSMPQTPDINTHTLNWENVNTLYCLRKRYPLQKNVNVEYICIRGCKHLSK